MNNIDRKRLAKELLKIKRRDLSAAELKAIEEHKYYMGTKSGHPVSIDEAILDFFEHFIGAFRKFTTYQDNLEERRLIEEYKFLKSQEVGYDIGFDKAAIEWTEKYAAIWREERENLINNGFLTMKSVVKNRNGLHLRPSSTLANVAKRFYCDIYVCREDMPEYNFILNGKRYLNVKSLLGLLTLAAAEGDELTFIAHGREAEVALQAINKLIEGGFSEVALKENETIVGNRQ